MCVSVCVCVCVCVCLFCTQIAVTKEAADTWSFIESESERRRQLLRDEELRAAIEKAKPRSKKARKVKPWVSQGSEVRVYVCVTGEHILTCSLLDSTSSSTSTCRAGT